MHKKLRIQTKLLEIGYKKNVLEKTLEDISSTDSDIYDAILNFVQDDSVKNISQPPIDVTMLMDTYGMNPIAAFLFIDWYRKEPNNALQCLALGIDDITDIVQLTENT